MTPKMKQYLDRLNQDLDKLFAEMETVSYERLNQKAHPDKWSATQVMHHLILSEKMSVAYCRKKLSFEPTLKKAGISASMRAYATGIYLKTPFKVKAPKAISGNALPSESSLESIMSSWVKSRADLEQFLKDVPVQYLDKEVYRHPFAGRLSLDGMLQFFSTHFHHHIKQIDKAIQVG